MGLPVGTFVGNLDGLNDGLCVGWEDVGLRVGILVVGVPMTGANVGDCVD